MLEPGEVLGQAVYVDSPRATPIADGWVVDAAVHFQMRSKVKVRAVLTWESSSYFVNPPDLTADHIPFLPAQIGHTVWRGDELEVDTGSLALRIPVRKIEPNYIGVAVTGMPVVKPLVVV